MTEVWRGLHNTDQHSQFEVGGGVVCDRCWTGDHRAVCYRDQPCRCCLAAEVEALRAQVQRVRELPKYDSAGSAEKLVWYYAGWNDAVNATFRALDGDT